MERRAAQWRPAVARVSSSPHQGALLSAEQGRHGSAGHGTAWLGMARLGMAGQDEDWRAAHRPPDPDDDVGAPLHQLDRVMPDFYERPSLYHFGEPGQHEATSAAFRVRGRPDAKVRIYRALPAQHAHRGFQPGDWVSTSKEYARQHARQTDPKHDWPVIRTSVRAGELWTHGDSVAEYGYHGPARQGMVSHKGGYHQEVRQHADGVIRPVQRRQAENNSACDDSGSEYTDPHERHAAKGKSRGQGQARHPQGADRRDQAPPQQAVSADQGQAARAEEVSGAIAFHPAAAKDLRKLDPQLRARAHNKILELASSPEHSDGSSTERLQRHFPKQKWYSTRVDRGTRIFHQSEQDGALYIGGVFAQHDYDAAVRRLAVQGPPQDLYFTQDEYETGGSKYPLRRHLRAHTPDEGQLGALIYYPPRRRNGVVKVHNLHVVPDKRRRGVGSALMDEMQRRHPDSTINHGDRTFEGEDWWAGYTQDKSVRRGRTAALDWADPGHKPDYEPLHESASDDEIMAHGDRQRAIRNDWQRDVRHGLAMGHLSNADALERGYHGSGHDRHPQVSGPNWAPLPSTLFHVSTDVPSVHRHGLKSRDELGQASGKGLGGGESDTISYTDDPKIARDIHHSLGEFHDVVTGKVSPHQLMERARTGDMGSRPFEREMRDSNLMNIDRVLRGRQKHPDMTPRTQSEMDAEHGPGKYLPDPERPGWEAPRGHVHLNWERESTPDEHREDAAQLYKHFAHWRQYAGGHPDPLFFGTDVKGLAATRREDHGIVKVHAKPGAQGYQLRSLGEWRSPTGHNVTVDRSHDPHTAAVSFEAARQGPARRGGSRQGTAGLGVAGKEARFTPHERVFGRTWGMDRRLWEPSGQLKADVRVFLLRKVGRWLSGHYGPGWEHWARIYFAGSEASMWTGPDLVGNSDFDTLIGINYAAMRKAVPALAHASNARITDMLNDQLKAELRDPAEMIPVEGTLTGPWDATFYVNKDSWDIRDIRPYAAFDVGANEWAVKPPDLPDWSLDKMPKPVVKALKAAESYARDILKLPEPQRTQQGAALFDSWHSDRSRAFSPHGEGWYDFGNLREKWLDQVGLWKDLVECKHRDEEGLGMGPEDWSNTPPYYEVPDTPVTTPKKYKTHAEFRAAQRKGLAKEGTALAPERTEEEEEDEPHEYPPIYREHLSTPDGRRSRPVTHEQFQEHARRGHQKFEQLRREGGGSSGLDDNWDKLVRHAYKETRTPWGGTTIHTGTGTRVHPDSWGYALTTRAPGTPEITVPHDASHEEFGKAMRRAREVHGDMLQHRGAHLGVFRDEDKKTIDFDPVTLVHKREDVDDIGAYTRATGGAYYYRDGDGYWPPHVSEEARAARHHPVTSSYGDYLHGGGLDRVREQLYSQPQHQPGEQWATDQFPGTVGWVRTEKMLPLRHHDATANPRSPGVTEALAEGFRHGEGWLSPLQLNYSAEDHAAWLGEGNHRLEAARRAGESHVPVTIAHVRGGELPGHYRPAPFPQKVHSYPELKALRGQSGDTIHPAHILPTDWFSGRGHTASSTRLERAWGAGHESALFGDGPLTSGPWQQAGRRKDLRDFDPALVQAVVNAPEHHHMQDVDPRILRATQGSLIRPGLRHYLGDRYERTGETYADMHLAGNRRPIVYRREDGQHLILSGHHRAAAALLQGRPLQAVVVSGPWGPPR